MQIKSRKTYDTLELIENKQFFFFFNARCGAKELSNPGPLYSEPKAHVEEEETPEDEQRKSKLPRDIAEDNPILGQLRL